MVENLPKLVCTSPPSKDHTYGISELLVVEAQQAASAVDCDAESPVDEVYDFGEICCYSEVSSSDSTEASSDLDLHGSTSPGRQAKSRHSWIKPEDDADDEEQKRLEGVRALLNLASATKVDSMKKSRRHDVGGPLWAKAVSTRLKKQNKRIGKVQKKNLNKRIGEVQKKKSNKSKGRKKRKVVRKRAS